MKLFQKFKKWLTKRRHRWVRTSGVFPTYVCRNCFTVKRVYSFSPTVYQIPSKFGMRTCYQRPDCQKTWDENLKRHLKQFDKALKKAFEAIEIVGKGEPHDPSIPVVKKETLVDQLKNL